MSIFPSRVSPRFGQDGRRIRAKVVLDQPLKGGRRSDPRCERYAIIEVPQLPAQQKHKTTHDEVNVSERYVGRSRRLSDKERKKYLADKRRKGRVAVYRAVLTDVLECAFFDPR